MAFKVQLCGEFRIWRDGEEITPLFSRAGGAKTLLKIFLAYPGRILTRDELIEWLWPEKPFNAGFANLRKRISELRHLLEPQLPSKAPSQYIFTRPGCYRLHPQAPITSDAQEFLRRWQIGQKLEQDGQLQRALSEYETALAPAQDDYLAEDRYEEWAAGPRERWQALLCQALAHLAERYTQLQRYSEALELCHRILALNPTCEEAYYRKMLCYYLAGNSGEALQSYQECVQTLKTHFGTPPSAETEELHQKILRRDRIEVPSYTPPTNLPQPLTSFIGREREIAQAKQLLLNTRLLTLTGTGGCGKTRLALKVAGDLVGEYAHGVWFVDLTALSDTALVPQQIIVTLGLNEMPGRPPREALIEQLRHRELLLVLDNCEQLLPQLAHSIKILLTACPNLQILTTSRTALGVPGETLLSVPPLESPPPGHLPPLKILQQTEAVSLFIKRALALKPSFQLTAENAPFVAQICRQLDGIPLAIELAAARIKVLSLEQIAARLNDLFTLLGEANPTAPSQQKTLKATMDWSFQLLTEAERALLQRLSVFVGGFSLEAAEAVAPDDPRRERVSQRRRGRIRAGQVLELLSHLVDKSLVIAEEQSAQMRYRMLETVRQYAHEKLSRTGEVATMRNRHLTFFWELAQRAEPELQGPQSARWLERLEMDYDDLHHALRWALESGQAETMLKLTIALGWFWYIRGHWSEGRYWLEKALAEKTTSAPLRAKALGIIGGLAYRQGDYPVASASYEESLTLCRTLDDPQGIANALNNLGVLAHSRGDFQAARKFYEESLAVQRRLHSKPSIARTLNNLGGIAWAQGDYAAARAFHQESLAIRKELSDQRGIATSLANLGLVSQNLGDYEEAQRFFEESLAIERQLDNKQGLTNVLTSLGALAQLRGDYAAARRLYEESQTIQQQLGEKRAIAHTLHNLGLIAHFQGNYQEAHAFYVESLELRRALGDRHGIGYSLNALGDLALVQGDCTSAKKLYEEALALQRELGDRQGIGYSLTNLGELARAQGDYQTARALCEESLALRRELGDKRALAHSLSALAALACAQGDYARAKSLGEDGLVCRKELGERRAVAQSLTLLATAARGLGELEQAYALCKESLELRREINDRAGCLESLEEFSRVLLAQGALERATILMGAAEALREALQIAQMNDEQEENQRGQDLKILESRLGKSEFTALWARGRAMSLDQAIEEAFRE
ncbi:tetratricopeptide repeat protein [Candidatus Acetothermia bacterium]|jgi:predicted ATPase/DNA-binding SARP family transcriptional activator/Tfp pilus assembly protein PilF|nr:tetratricopeptide repeat protein [Candidatus Acetothermia bacterium]MCI2436607.1 tetratricopeptide repeat protein [Candidatus Acetothermia bacterium]